MQTKTLNISIVRRINIQVQQFVMFTLGVHLSEQTEQLYIYLNTAYQGFDPYLNWKKHIEITQRSFQGFCVLSIFANFSCPTSSRITSLVEEKI